MHLSHIFQSSEPLSGDGVECSHTCLGVASRGPRICTVRQCIVCPITSAFVCMFFRRSFARRWGCAVHCVLHTGVRVGCPCWGQREIPHVVV